MSARSLNRAARSQERYENEFEFLRGLPFGLYQAAGSPLHRLDPRTRILMVVLFLTALLAARSWLGLVICIAAALAGWRAARVPFEPLWRGWVKVLPFLLFLVVLQIFFQAAPDLDVLFRVGSRVISSGDLLAGLSVLLRFTGFIAVLGLSSAILSESEITRALESLLKPLSLLHIPIQDFVMALQVTLRFIPLLAQTAERIAKAQASRGANWKLNRWNIVQQVRQITPMIVPLFVASLRKAENMALAMDARGYGSFPVRTSLIALKYKREDALALLGTAALCLAAALLR